MAQTMNKEARGLTVRTYEGVQWFKHGPTWWVASIPGTSMAVYRTACLRFPGKWNARVARFDHDLNEFVAILNLEGAPWVKTRGTVGEISRNVQVLRAFIDSRMVA